MGGGKGPLIQKDKSGTLATGNDQTLFQPKKHAYGVTAKGNGDVFISEERHTTLSAGGGQAGQGYPCCLQNSSGDDIAGTLDASYYKGVGARGGKEREIVCMATQQGGAEIRTDDKAPTLTAAAGMSGNNQPVYANAEYTVRRLTPLECERLQGFPDHWTDIGEWTDSNGKKHKDSDSPRYKALGNSIALPSWAYVLSKLSLCCGDDHTMASLFDGIGGFPLVWMTLHNSDLCLWASEIEEFPIAVTKVHFSEE